MKLIAFKMVESMMTWILFIWVTISLIALSQCQNIPEIKNLDCFNDYIANMFCSWEVDSSRNCSEDFSVKGHSNSISESIFTCYELGNDQHNGHVVPNACRCHIKREYFITSENFFIEVIFHGKIVGNTSLNAYLKVKPLAPSNVQVEPQDEQISVTWNKRYDGFPQNYLVFQLQVLSKLDRKQVFDLDLMETTCHINKRLLERGDYLIRVRSKFKESEGKWSEWSPEFEWNNDYSLSMLLLLKVILPAVCLFLLLIILTSYLCITRCGKKWWNAIPDPSKSLLANKLLQNKPFLDRKKDSTKNSCKNYLIRRFKAHRTKCNKPEQNPKPRECIQVNGCSDCKKVVFELQDEVIENAVEMYPIQEDEKSSIQEDDVEYNSHHHVPAEDSCFENMFSDILSNDNLLSPKMDVFNNFNTVDLFRWPSLKDTLDIEKVQRSNAAVRQESGYHSYDSDESTLDVQSDNGKDLLPCIPSVSIKETGLDQNKEVLLLNTGYNSFANALAEARIDSVMDTKVSLWLDNFSKNILLEKRIHLPMGIIYTNTKPCFSDTSEDNAVTNISQTPSSVFTTISQNHGDQTFTCHVSGYKSFDQSVQENGPALGCHASGYKSFDQTVQENSSALGCHITSGYDVFDQTVQENSPELAYHKSGYKSVDQAVRENASEVGCHMSGGKSFDLAVQKHGPDLECHMSGYKSFDQAVQENGSECGCHTSGYKSFDQAVQENGPELRCHISGYKSFDQAVQENGSKCGGHMSGYKSFDQAVQENGPELRCHISGYKSFDQAVQENAPTVGCDMSDYKSFDLAVQENGPELRCPMSGYKSFDQAVQENGSECGCHMSGYKSFDQAVQENGPELICHISGYKSFDQAVQENGSKCGGHMSGYKSFDQAVQENGPERRCHISGYKSFDQAVQEKAPTVGFDMSDYKCFGLAVQENGPEHGSEHKCFDQAVQESGLKHEYNMSRYTSFDLAVQENAPALGFNISGYKSFDQAVQENGQAQQCHEHKNVRVTGYQSFTQAVQQGETSRTTDFSVVDLVYKPFESLVPPKSDVSDNKCFVHENESQYQLGDSPSKRITDSLNTAAFIHEKESSLGLPSLDCCSMIRRKKEAVDTNDNSEKKLNNNNRPLALTFDICEHSRNLKNIHGLNVSPHMIYPGIFQIMQPTLPCLAGQLQSGHEATTVNKTLTIQNCPPIINIFENLSYFLSHNQLQNEDFSQTATHVLIQQCTADKDGNSYMKLGVA